MLTHPKVSPLIPHTISLSSPYNHQNFLCKNPKLSSHFHLNSILEQDENSSLPDFKKQKYLLKIFKGFKRIKKLHQNDLVLHRIQLPVPKTRYLIKKVKRAECLDLHGKLHDIKGSPTRLDLWLKYAKSLKNINYQLAVQNFALKKSIISFEREIQQCLTFLPQHRELVEFTLRLAKSSPKVLESLLQFQRYPPSLKTFAIYQQKADDPRISSVKPLVSAFSRLKSLDSLTLSGPKLIEITEILLNRVPALSNLKKLNVQVFQVKVFGPTFDLNRCQTLENLRYLKISNLDEDIDLSLLTNPPQLESLDIVAGVELKGLGLISEFISLFKKSLKSLKVDILHSYGLKTEEKMKNLLSKISELEMLTSFKFKVKNMAPPWTNVTLSPEILENLKGLVKLESFEWEVPKISGPGIFFDLLKLLEESRLTLKKLKIFHALIELEKSQEPQLFDFIKSLESVEVLYLTGFNIMEEPFWVDLVNCLQEMKLLRFLGLGNVPQGLLKKWFTRPLKKMAQKKGLEVLKIDSSLEFGEEFLERPICLKDIIKVNPALREVSQHVRELFNFAGLE